MCPPDLRVETMIPWARTEERNLLSLSPAREPSQIPASPAADQVKGTPWPVFLVLPRQMGAHINTSAVKFNVKVRHLLTTVTRQLTASRHVALLDTTGSRGQWVESTSESLFPALSLSSLWSTWRCRPPLHR